MISLFLRQATAPLIIIATVLQFISLTEGKILELHKNKISNIESLDRLANDTNMQYETKNTLENLIINNNNITKDIIHAVRTSKAESISRMKHLNYLIEHEIGIDSKKENYSETINRLANSENDVFVKESETLFGTLKTNIDQMIEKKDDLVKKSQALNMEIYQYNIWSLALSALSAICAVIPKDNN